MSILIRGMKKPDCYSCPFAHDGWPDEWEMHCVFLNRQVGHFGKKLKKPKDCPIVEVPTPHGRMIDADALKVSLVFAEKTAKWAVPALRAVLMVIDEMPTIIEAEEGAEE